jgi:hypothetical protein
MSEKKRAMKTNHKEQPKLFEEEAVEHG